jgi:signal transduction histidine kinase
MGEKDKESVEQLRAALRREESRARAIMEVGRSLTAISDIDELLRLIVDRVTVMMEADRSTIFLVDEDSREIWSKVAQGEEIAEIRMPVGKGIAGWAIQNGRNINLKDVYQDDRFNPDIDKSTGYHTESLLCVPLRGKQGNILGVIQTLNKKGGHFSVEDERLLEAICSQVSIAIENAQLVLSVLDKNIELVEAQERLARKVMELDVLYKLEKEISSAIGQEESLYRLLRKAVDLVGCDAGSIVILAEDSEELIFASAVGSREDAVRRLRLPRGAGVAGWVAEHGQTALVNDPQSDPRHLQGLEKELEFPVKNILAVPLAVAGDLIGAVELLNKKAGPFESDDEKLATLIAGQAAAAVQVGRLREQREKEERLSSIGQMLSGVIHDFRTPMTIISGYVQLMSMEESEATRKEQAEVILQQFDFVNNMTRELLAFARGDSSLLLHKIYTDQLLKNMQELLTKELDAVQVKLKVEDLYGGPIRVDENKLRRLIFNITRNARQAMPQGGEFHIRVEEQDGRVCFHFTDTGPGIPEEIRTRLFEYFVSSGKEEGTGLGLAVVKKIVDEHGGQIEVESPPGGGACFKIFLPKRLDT